MYESQKPFFLLETSLSVYFVLCAAFLRISCTQRLPLHVVFEDTAVQEDKSFFSEIIASLSDVKFSADGRSCHSVDLNTFFNVVFLVKLNLGPLLVVAGTCCLGTT